MFEMFFAKKNVQLYTLQHTKGILDRPVLGLGVPDLVKKGRNQEKAAIVRDGCVASRAW